MGLPMNPGLLYAGLAFGIWGLYPLYLLQIASVPPLEVVLHRSAWSLLFLLGLLAVLKRWRWLPAVGASRGSWRSSQRVRCCCRPTGWSTCSR
jgi:EamA domain-containing membrane protein RarD